MATLHGGIELLYRWAKGGGTLNFKIEPTLLFWGASIVSFLFESWANQIGLLPKKKKRKKRT
jgi:hypothetical protein